MFTQKIYWHLCATNFQRKVGDWNAERSFERNQIPIFREEK